MKFELAYIDKVEIEVPKTLRIFDKDIEPVYHSLEDDEMDSHIDYCTEYKGQRCGITIGLDREYERSISNPAVIGSFIDHTWFEDLNASDLINTTSVK